MLQARARAQSLLQCPVPQMPGGEGSEYPCRVASRVVILSVVVYRAWLVDKSCYSTKLFAVRYLSTLTPSHDLLPEA